MRGYIISIHSLVKRETRWSASWNGTLRYFNPLPRKEGDRVQNRFARLTDVISIHSLVKRETNYFVKAFLAHPNFNPLPRKEGDRVLQADYDTAIAISIHSLVKRETVPSNVFADVF